MEDYLYLVSLALISQNGERAMPIGGKSLKKTIERDSDLIPLGEQIVNEILIRVIQRSDNGPISRSNLEKSILLFQIPIESMQNNLPALKAEWISKGDSEKFISELKSICKNIWYLTFSRYEGTKFHLLE